MIAASFQDCTLLHVFEDEEEFQCVARERPVSWCKAVDQVHRAAKSAQPETSNSDDPVHRVALTMLTAMKSLDGIRHQAECVLGSQPHLCDPPDVAVGGVATIHWECPQCKKKWRRYPSQEWRA